MIKSNRLPVFSGIIILLLLVQACSTPKAVVRMNPETEQTKWFYGKEYALDSLNGVSVSMAFNRLIRPYIIFDMEVINNSNLPLLVDPASLFYKFSGDTIYTDSASVRFYAADPEKELFDIDMEISRLEARQKNSAMIGLVAAGVGVIAAITSGVENDYDNSERYALAADASFIASDIAAAVSVENDIEAMENEDLRYRWENAALRKTTLDPGQAIRGHLYFDYQPEARFYRFFFPIDDDYITHTFRQRKFLP